MGSEFEVLLPMSPAADADSEPVAAAPAPAAIGAQARRILIADDNVDAATSLALLLERAGHDVRVAHDGEQAITAAAAMQAELVLLDIGMPKLNGYDAAQQLRRLPGGDRMTIAALTGWAQPHDQERSRRAGIDHHFRKPVDIDDLLRFLQTSAAADSGIG
jgi:CheY-like chemotaxis protein